MDAASTRIPSRAQTLNLIGARDTLLEVPVSTLLFATSIAEKVGWRLARGPLGTDALAQLFGAKQAGTGAHRAADTATSGCDASDATSGLRAQPRLHPGARKKSARASRTPRCIREGRWYSWRCRSFR